MTEHPKARLLAIAILATMAVIAVSIGGSANILGVSSLRRTLSTESNLNLPQAPAFGGSDMIPIKHGQVIPQVSGRSITCRITTVITSYEDGTDEEEMVCIPVVRKHKNALPYEGDEDYFHQQGDEHYTIPHGYLPPKFMPENDEEIMQLLIQGKLYISIQDPSTNRESDIPASDEEFFFDRPLDSTAGLIFSLIPSASSIVQQASLSFTTPSLNSSSLTSRNLAQSGDRTRRTGVKSIAFVHVETKDRVPDVMQHNMVHAWMVAGATASAGGPSFNEQLTACSYGKLKYVNAGTYTVKLDDKISTFSTKKELVDAAEASLKNQIGGDIGSLADQVAFCYPKQDNVATWFATATYKHWRIQFNNEWCLSLGGAIHEVGHTMGLVHSGQGSSVQGDTTGYMGTGSKIQGTPAKCFNGHKTWLLNWYPKIVADVYKTQKFLLVANVHLHNSNAPNEFGVIKAGKKSFLLFNRKSSFNHETGEMGDRVTVTNKAKGGNSKLRKGLAEGQMFQHRNYIDGKSLQVKVCSMTIGTDKDVAEISIGLSGSPDACSSPVCIGKASTCSASSECCGTLACLGSKCDFCRRQGKSCTRDDDCCSGFSCSGGTCTS